MKPIEFLKKRNAMHRHIGPGAAFAVVGMLIFGIFVHLAALKHAARMHEDLSGWRGAGVEAIPLLFALVGFLTTRLVLCVRHDSFIKAHPEMDNLDKWTASIATLPTEQYPTSETEKAAIAFEVLAKLTDMAKKADGGFAFRDAVERLYLADKEIAPVAGYFMPQIHGTADEFNKYYLAFWDLMVGTMGINPTGYSDPRQFRESLRTVEWLS